MANNNIGCIFRRQFCIRLKSGGSSSAFSNNNLVCRINPLTYNISHLIEKRPVCYHHNHNNVISIRSLHIKPSPKKKALSRRYKTDHVPQDFDVIYQSSIGPWFVMFRVGMGTIAASLGSVFYILVPDMSYDFLVSTNGMVLCGATLVYLCFVSTFSVLARKFFTRIYMQPESGHFIGVRRSLFGRLKQMKYSLGDIKLKPSSSATPSSSRGKSDTSFESSTVYIKGHKIFLQTDNFISPKYFNLHTGRGPHTSEFMVTPKF